MNCKNCKKQGCSLAGKDHEMSFDCKLYVNSSAYEYSNFKVDPPKVDDGWYLVKDGLTYKVDVPTEKWRFTKSINILTGEVYYPSNADRIRSMTDEELAEFVIGVLCYTKLPYMEVREKALRGNELLDWLKQEADHD